MIDPRDYGVKGDNASDDTAAWAAFLAVVPNFATIAIPQNFHSKTGTIDLSGRCGLRWVGPGVPGSGPGFASSIVYTGAAGGDVFKGIPCAGMSFEGFEINANDRADFGFRASYGSSSPGVTTQRVTFANMSLRHGTNGFSTARPTFTGIKWGDVTNPQNCERLVVRDSYIIGSGQGSASVGINIDHSNAVSNAIDGNFIAYCGTGIKSRGGSVVIGSNTFDNNDLDIWYWGWAPIAINANRTENGKQFFNGNGSVSMRENVFANIDPASPAWININQYGTSGLVFENNAFDSDTLVPPFAAGTIGYIISRSNRYPVADVTNHRVRSMAQFASGYDTAWDGYPGGWVYHEKVHALVPA